MTVIGKDRYSDNMLKNRRYKASKCPQCKAKTHEEAEKLCRPTQDITGEYTCAGDESCLNPFGVHWDTSGRACELVAAGARAEAKALDDWCLAEMAKMEQTPPPFSISVESDWRALLHNLVEWDGGEGSKGYHASKLYDARQAALGASPAPRGGDQCVSST